MSRRPHFLTPLFDDPDGCVLRLERTGAVVARRVEPAFDSSTRRRGLLGRGEMAASTALILAPCNAVHTARMRFPIDVAFADRSGTILRLVAELKPWRIALCLRAFAVVELPGGAAVQGGLRVGDRLKILRLPSDHAG